MRFVGVELTPHHRRRNGAAHGKSAKERKSLCLRRRTSRAAFSVLVSSLARFLARNIRSLLQMQKENVGIMLALALALMLAKTGRGGGSGSGSGSVGAVDRRRRPRPAVPLPLPPFIAGVSAAAYVICMARQP